MPVPTPRCHFSFVMATCTSPRPFSECATGSSSTLVQNLEVFCYSDHPAKHRGVGVLRTSKRLTLFAVHILSFSRQIVFLFCFVLFLQKIQTAAHTYLNNFESPSIPANSLGRHSGNKTKWSEDRRPRSAHGGGDATPLRSAKNRLALGFIATSDIRVAFRDPARPREVRTDPRAFQSLHSCP